MSKIFFTSDTHFFHNNIIEYCNRPYGSVEHMNNSLVKNWNSVVSQEDTVWLLGDVSFGKPKETLELMSQLNGRICLVPGNHDRKGRTETKDLEDRCDVYPPYHLLRVESYRFVLCHFPFESWERGYINLHGHTHGTYKSKFMQYDVGVDSNNYCPILMQDAISRSIEHKKDDIYPKKEHFDMYMKK